MRSTIEIIVAVQNSQPVTDDELRLALLALSGIDHFIRRALDDIIEAADERPRTLGLRIAYAKGTRERMFKALKIDPSAWLGPGFTPGTPEYAERQRVARNIYKQATGEEL